jgi:hypothetical protein
MKKIINELINFSIKGVDVYRYKDTTWLIFTDEARWVIELVDGGTYRQTVTPFVRRNPPAPFWPTVPDRLRRFGFSLYCGHLVVVI